jgi:hypothetical protein
MTAPSDFIRAGIESVLLLTHQTQKLMSISDILMGRTTNKFAQKSIRINPIKLNYFWTDLKLNNTF